MNEMSPGDIRRNWREAKDPDMQIRILAELNDTTTDEIRLICGLPIKRRFSKGTVRYTSDEVTTIVEMWHEGFKLREIAARLGRSDHAIQSFTDNHRDLCPRRRKEKLL